MEELSQLKHELCIRSMEHTNLTNAMLKLVTKLVQLLVCEAEPTAESVNDIKAMVHETFASAKEFEAHTQASLPPVANYVVEPTATPPVEEIKVIRTARPEAKSIRRLSTSSELNPIQPQQDTLSSISSPLAAIPKTQPPRASTPEPKSHILPCLTTLASQTAAVNSEILPAESDFVDPELGLPRLPCQSELLSSSSTRSGPISPAQPVSDSFTCPKAPPASGASSSTSGSLCVTEALAALTAPSRPAFPTTRPTRPQPKPRPPPISDPFMKFTATAVK